MQKTNAAGGPKAGETAKYLWPDKPEKARQKDTDARWIVKFAKAKPMLKRSAQANAKKSAIPAHLEHPIADAPVYRQ